MPLVTSVTVAVAGSPPRSSPSVRRCASVGAETRNRSSSSRVTVGSISMPPPRVAHRRVHHASRRDVDVARAQPLQPLQRTGPLHQELRVRRQVEQRRRLARGPALHADRVEPARPVERVRVLARRRNVRREPVRPLPARGLAEHRARGVQPLGQRRPPHAPRGRRLQHRPVHRVQPSEHLPFDRSCSHARPFCQRPARAMSTSARSIVGCPSTIHSASALPAPGA